MCVAVCSYMCVSAHSTGSGALHHGNTYEHIMSWCVDLTSPPTCLFWTLDCCHSISSSAPLHSPSILSSSSPFCSISFPLNQNEMSLRQETRWHKSLRWLIVFWDGEGAITDPVMMWTTQKALRRAVEHVWLNGSFQCFTSRSNSFFLIVSFHMIDRAYEKQKLQCILNRHGECKIKHLKML